MKRFWVLLFLAACCSAAGSAQGTMPRWEVEELAKNIDEQTATLEKLLNEVRPKEWIQDGAPEAYVTQYDELRENVNNVRLSAQDMGRRPDKVSSVVDTFLWLDRLGSILQSVEAGVRKYQNAAVADMLQSAATRRSGSEERLKEYMRQLIVQREQEMEIAHAEAQRCREFLSKRPPQRD